MVPRADVANTEIARYFDPDYSRSNGSRLDLSQRKARNPVTGGLTLIISQAHQLRPHEHYRRLRCCGTAYFRMLARCNISFSSLTNRRPLGFQAIANEKDHITEVEKLEQIYPSLVV
jgi:hypothetical protein